MFDDQAASHIYQIGISHHQWNECSNILLQTSIYMPTQRNIDSLLRRFILFFSLQFLFLHMRKEFDDTGIRHGLTFLLESPILNGLNITYAL